MNANDRSDNGNDVICRKTSLR